jgi:hypothetical protein
MTFTVNQFIHRVMVTTAITATVMGITSGILSGLLLATATPASAKQFKKLLQLGQTVPGNNQPIEEIIEPTIGLDQQVAVLLKTKTIQTDPGPPGSNIPTTRTFKGIYSIRKDGTIRLMDGGASTAGFGGANRQEFSAPSISQGKIAYLSITQSEGRGGLSDRVTAVRVGTPGQVRTALSLNLSAIPAVSGLANLAFVNGKAYFLNVNGFGDGGPLGVIDTLAATPSLVPLRSTQNTTALRASSQGLVITEVLRGRVPVVQLFESSGDANFTDVSPPVSLAGNCGFSVSLDNLAVCAEQGSITNIFLRFGRGSNVTAISPPPNPAPLPPSKADRVSISNRSVIFSSKQFVLTSSYPIDKIYLSENGQAPSPIISGGDVLDGKTVSQLELSNNGRTIAGKSVVFTATFTDGTRALYRVDL